MNEFNGLVESYGSDGSFKFSRQFMEGLADFLANSVLVAGANVTVTYNEAAGTITIASTGGGPGGGTWTEVEIDFGSLPVYDKTLTVTDAAVTGTSKVVVVPSGNAPTGLTADEWLWDTITFAALAGTGQFTLYATPNPGPVMGKRKIFYQVT